MIRPIISIILFLFFLVEGLFAEYTFDVSIIHHSGLNIKGSFGFDIINGESLSKLVDDWCKRHIERVFTELDRLKVHNYLMTKTITGLIETHEDISDTEMIGAILVVDEYGKRIKLNYKLLSGQNFSEKVNEVYESLINLEISEEVAIRGLTNFLDQCWKIIETSWNMKHLELSYNVSKAVLSDPKLIVTIDNPSAIPTGLGNILIAFLSCYSIHEQTYIKNLPNFIMGNYSEILSHKHIYSLSKEKEIGLRIESFITHHLLLLREEEVNTDGIVLGTIHRMPSSPYLTPIFSNISVQAVYNRSALPHNFVRRILKAVRKIDFLPWILEIAHDIGDRIESPSLGVSVRSWNSTHEQGYTMNMSFDIRSYFHSIINLLSEHMVRTIVCAFDNPVLKAEFELFFSSFDNRIRVIYFEHDANISPLQKAAIEMLTLSTTTYLIGDKRSSFLQLSYWFGKCRQIVKIVAEPSSMTYISGF